MVSAKEACVYRLVLSSNHWAKRLFIVRTKKLRNKTNESVETSFLRVLMAIRVCSKILHGNIITHIRLTAIPYACCWNWERWNIDVCCGLFAIFCMEAEAGKRVAILNRTHYSQNALNLVQGSVNTRHIASIKWYSFRRGRVRKVAISFDSLL